MKSVWKIIFDVIIAIFAIYFGYRVFIYCGQKIPGFGYFPIGLIAGVTTGIAIGYLGHGIELFVAWILHKFNIEVLEDAPWV